MQNESPEYLRGFEAGYQYAIKILTTNQPQNLTKKQQTQQTRQQTMEQILQLYYEMHQLQQKGLVECVKYYQQLLDIKKSLKLTQFEIEMMSNYARNNSNTLFSMWSFKLSSFLNGCEDKKMQEAIKTYGKF